MGAVQIIGRARVRRCHPYVATYTAAGLARDPSVEPAPLGGTTSDRQPCMSVGGVRFQQNVLLTA